MQKYQNMLTTGKRLNQPSDDPVGVSYAMRYEAQLNRNEQYARNLDSAKSFLEMTDTTLSGINDLMQRARELAVQGANDTVPPDAKKAIAQEIDELYDEMIKLGNTKFNGKYIFNGQMTDIAPYSTVNPETQNPDSKDVVMAVSDGVNMPASISGQLVFGKDVTQESDNIFSVLQTLSTELNNDNAAGVDAVIGLIDTRMTKIQEAWAEVGARNNRLELIQRRLKDADINLNKLQSQTEDADVAEIIVRFKTQENVHRAALDAGARVIQPTLVDFLR